MTEKSLILSLAGIAGGVVLGLSGCSSDSSSAPKVVKSEEGGLTAISASMHTVKPPSAPRLPINTVFKGESRYRALMARGEREGWRNLPLGNRTVKFATAMLGLPYVNYTLEVDDHIESPVVNLNGMDCWTFYENALGMARLLRYKPGPYTKQDLLHMIELERYRGGRCTGNYLSRLHHLEEVFYDNQRRGLGTNITPSLPGAVRMRREIREMSVSWRSYRYLRNNRELIPKMAKIERRVSGLTVYQIPKSKVRAIESRLQSGDICAITSNWKYGYTSHVGLIVRRGNRAWFMHATSMRDKGRRMILDKPISDYLREGSSHAGIVIFRPRDLPPSKMWHRQLAAR
jgi:hypothetical protein